MFSEITGFFEGTTAFSTTVPFSKGQNYVTSSTLTSNVTLTPQLVGVRPNSKTVMTLIGDGTHSPSFDAAFKKMSSSGSYSTTTGNINLLYFYFDGTNYYYSIEQGGSPTNPIIAISNMMRYYSPTRSAIVKTGNNITSISDLSPLNITATASLGNPQWNASKVGIDFNTGTNFSISSLTPGSLFSFVIVMENNSLAGSLGIFLEGTSNYYVLTATNFYSSIDGATANVIPLTMTWNAGEKAVFVYTINGSKLITIYKNGTSVGTFTTTQNPLSAGANILKWGADSGARVPDGTVYDFLFFNKVLSSTEIGIIVTQLKADNSIP